MNNILSVLILNRNHADDVLRIYDDLKKQTFQDFHVIIIDDNSDENELKKLMDVKDERFFVYSYPKPFRFGLVKKWNFGFKKAIAKKSKYIYLLQSDQRIIDDNTLSELVIHMENNSNCGAVGPTILNRNGDVTWGPGIVKNRMGHEYCVSESFLVRVKCLKEMGLWKDIFIYYGEEMDFFNWLRNNHYQTHILPGVKVVHYGGGVTSSFQNHKDYYRPRTSILIMKLYNKKDSFIKKICYLRSECWEQEVKLKTYIKNMQVYKFVRTTVLLCLGIIAGLLIPISQRSEK